MRTFLKTCLLVLLLVCSCDCIRLRIPIGVIVEPDRSVDLTVIKYGLYVQGRGPDWPKQYVMEIASETAASDNLTELDKAVCGLLRQGVYAIIAPITPISYQLLSSYSTEYEVPLIGPVLPEIPREYVRNKFTVGIQPSTTRAIVDLIRDKRWDNLVFLYDDTQGPERLQKIFQLGYSAFNGLSIIGVKKVSDADQVNQYLRKLEQAQRHRMLNVILDTDPDLAKDIIVRHVHDIFVGKNNFHFLITTPVLEEYWSSYAVDFGAMNVTGFLALSSESEKAFKDEWMSLSSKAWQGAGAQLNVSSYFSYDAVYLLGAALTSVFRKIPYRAPADQDLYLDHSRYRDCLESPSVPLPLGPNITFHMKKGVRHPGLTGAMEFDDLGSRKNFQIPIIEISASRKQLVGSWSDAHGLQIFSNSDASSVPAPLPRKENRKYIVTSVLSPPFLMLKNNLNGTTLTGNDRYEGFVKDFLELLAHEVDIEYELKLSNDGSYGWFNKPDGKWNGMIGEILTGTADLAASDLIVNAERLRVVDFLDSYMTASLSILMKNPQSVASETSMFLVGAFSATVWLCILVSAVVVIVLFHITLTFTGAPDTIEAASGVWSKKFSLQQSLWFIIGTGLFQGTGIYPRSISCRILAAAWWCFILMLTTLFIASITTQLSQFSDVDGSTPQARSLESLTLEPVVAEAYRNQWPNIGIVKNGAMHRYVKQSSLPFLKDYKEYLDQHPELFVSRITEGVARVRKSNGDYALFMQSHYSDYFSISGVCDTIAVRDLIDTFHYAIAMPLGSPLKLALGEAQEKLKQRGELHYLHQIWFSDKSRCATNLGKNGTSTKGLYSFSGLLYILLAAFAIIFVIGVLQYFWRLRKKNRARRNISFEEVTMPHNLPHPPPELLRDTSLEEDNEAIDGWAERRLVPTSFSRNQAEE